MTCCWSQSPAWQRRTGILVCLNPRPLLTMPYTCRHAVDTQLLSTGWGAPAPCNVDQRRAAIRPAPLCAWLSVACFTDWGSLRPRVDLVRGPRETVPVQGTGRRQSLPTRGHGCRSQHAAVTAAPGNDGKPRHRNKEGSRTSPNAEQKKEIELVEKNRGENLEFQTTTTEM